MTVTKRELTTKLHERQGITRKIANDHVEALIGLIKATLERGENVKIAGFGVFDVRAKKARRGRNPQTGDVLTIEPRRVITFKASNLLKDKINGAT